VRIEETLLALGGFLLAALGLASSGAHGQSQGSPPGSPTPSLRPEDLRIDVRPETPRLIAVRLRHDLCPICREVEPNLESARELADAVRVLLIDVDLTNAATQRQSSMLLAALGLDEIWPTDLSALGTITVFDGETLDVLSSVQATDAEQLEASLQKAIDLVGAREGKGSRSPEPDDR
jgi:hypothetical protein